MPIINMVYKKKKGWKPGANTIAYYPLTTDTQLNDLSGNGYNLTNGGTGVFGTYGGVSCVNFPTAQYSLYNTSVPVGSIRTQMARCYLTGTSYKAYSVIYTGNVNYASSGQLLGSYIQYNSSGQHPGTANWKDSTSASSITISGWSNICLVGSGNNHSLYVNGQLVSSNNYSAITSSSGIYIGGVTSGSNTPYQGYMSNVILEDKARTTDEITAYYNQTKSIYEDKIENYQEVQYIENTSTGPRIDTGVTPTQNTKSQIKFRNLGVTGNVIYGMYNGDDNSDYRLFNYGSNIYWDLGSSRVNGSTCNANTDYEFEIGNNYVKNVGASGNLVSGSAVGSYTGNTTIKLNHGSNGLSANRWYYVKIWDGATQVRDMIPCYRKADSVIGMYDKVNNKFYINSGSGTFTKGPDVN